MNRRQLLLGMPALAAGGAISSRGDAGGPHAARLRTAICAYSFRDALQKGTMTYDDLVRMAVEHDIDGLDLTVYWFPSTADDFLLPLRRLAYRNGVEIYSLSIRTDMCRPPGELREREIAGVKRWVDAAVKLGAGHIRVFGGDVPKGASEDEAAGWAAETLKRSAEYSGSRGILLGLENHGGITSRAERILQIIKAAGSPWVGINLDTGNFDADGYRQIAQCAPYAVNVQVKTEIRVAGGKREPQDWNRIAEILARSGYKGYLALEYEARQDPAAAVPRLLDELRRVARRYSS